MSKATKIIGFRGKKGTGKNFVANVTSRLIEGQDSGTVKVEAAGFADAFKGFCVDVLGLNHEQCHGSDEQKNTITSYLWPNMPQFVRDRYPDKTGYLSGREIMQVFATDFMRDCFDEKIWIKAMHRRILASPAHFFLITDVRFENEVKAIKSWKGEVWQIDGPQRGQEETKADTHQSEAELEKDIAVDRIIDNGLGRTEQDIRQQIVDFL